MNIETLKAGMTSLKSSVDGFKSAGLFQKQIMAEVAVLEAAALLGLLVAVVEALEDRVKKLEGGE